MNDTNQDHHTKRDAETLMVLGGFMTILAIPVLIGTVWAATTIAQVVNLAAGLILLAIGVGVFLRGWWTGKNLS